MTSIDKDGIRLSPQDLSSVYTSDKDHGRLFNHDGSTSITLFDGVSTSSPGIYLWDMDVGGWRGLKSNANTLNGQQASDFADVEHSHDDLYYTETEADALFLPKSGGSVSGPLDFSFEANSTFVEFIESIGGESLSIYVNNDGKFALVPVGNDGLKKPDESLWYDPATGVWEIGDNTVLHQGNLDTSAYDSHIADTANPHGVSLDQASPAGGDVDLADNYVDGKYGYFGGYLTTAQSNIDGGTLANYAENVSVNRGLTVDSSSRVTVNRTGDYRLTYGCDFDQTGGDNRAGVAARWQVNGVAKDAETRQICYLRMTGSGGDRNGVSSSDILSLTSGDYLELYVWKVTGATGHRLTHAHVSIEYLG